MRCLYCRETLDRTNESDAHVFPKGLGGRLKSREICCKQCNNSFTAHEGVCAERVAVAGGLLGAYRGDRRLMSGVFELRGAKFRAEGGEAYEEAPPPSNKGTILPIPARADRQISSLANSLKEKRLPPDAILQGRFQIVDAPQNSAAPPELGDPDFGIPIEMSWGDASTTRVMVKTACELVARERSEVARCVELAAARDYARHGVGGLYIAFNTGTEGARLPLVEAPFINGVEVWSRRELLYMRFTLFTHFRWAGVLATDWTQGPMRASYSFDARNPSNGQAENDSSDCGDFVVRRTPELSRSELCVASRDFGDAMGNLFTNRRAYRAEALSLEELHLGVSALFIKSPWPLIQESA